jgi:xylulokinase
VPLVAGVDCSTQATKVVLVDVDDGRVVAAGAAAHDVDTRDAAGETDPRVWRAALTRALADTGKAQQVSAIAVAGQQHGLVVCGADVEPLRPALLWNDTRSAPQAEALVDAFGGAAWWAHEVGVVPVASITATKWAWLRAHEPHVADGARAVCLPHDWLTGQLTGTNSTDRGDASGTGWWSVPQGRYREDVLDHVRLDPGLLPVVREPEENAGTVSAAAAEQFGLREGIPVGVGTGDNMGAALALGAHPGLPVLSLGTSGTVFVTSERPAADPSGVVAGFADATGRFLPLACTLNCTLAVDRVAGWLGLDRDDVAPRTDVTFLPYLDGERTPNLPAAAGMLAGLRHATTPQQILLAAYEGAVASLMEALGALAEHSSGVAADAPLVLVGGGARGAAWQAVAARLSGRPLRLPGDSEFVALGAAAQAAATLVDEPPAHIARAWGHGSGRDLPAVEQDEAALTRITAARHASLPLLQQPSAPPDARAARHPLKPR